MQDEIGRVYHTFERAIDKLSHVLDEHSARQEKLNDRLEAKIDELERSHRIAELELDRRIKNLEEERIARETRKGMVVKAVSMFPKISMIVLFVVCAVIAKVTNEVSLNEYDQKRVEAERNADATADLPLDFPLETTRK